MSDFIYDFTNLPNGKSDARPLLGPANQALVAAEWNLTVQGMYDARNAILTGTAINVKRYGAKGDGVTDDTSAIQSAINAAGANQGIFLPPGSYIISNLVIGPQQILFGAGMNQTLLKGKAGSAGIFITDNGSAAGVVLKDFACYCNNVAGYTDIIKLGYNGTAFGNQAYIANIVVRDAPNAIGMHLNGAIGYGYNITATNVADGFIVDGTSNNFKILSVISPVGAGGHFSAKLSGCTVHGLHLDAPASSSVPLYINSDSSVDGLSILLANNTTLDHVIEINTPTVKSWQVSSITYSFGNAPNTVTITNGNIKDDASGAFLGGNATGGSLTGDLSSFSNRITGNTIVVNALAYGCVPDGTTDNWTAITNAVLAANALNAALYFPAGTYAIQLPTNLGPYNGFAVTANLFIYGDGPLKSKLKIINFAYPGGGAGGVLFKVSDNVNLTIWNLNIEGPTPRIVGAPATQLYPQVIQSSNGNIIELRNMYSSLFAGIFDFSTPNMSLTPVICRVYDCKLSHRGAIGFLIPQPVEDRTDGLFLMRNTSIQQDADGFTEAELDNPGPQGIANCYIYPTYSVDIDGCQFNGAIPAGQQSTSLYMQRGDLGGGSVAPKYVRIQNCFFSGNIFKSIKCSQQAQNIIVNCTFEASTHQQFAIDISGDAKIIGCTFYGGQPNAGPDNYFIQDILNRPVPRNVLVQGCTFINKAVGTANQLYDIRKSQANSTTLWTIRDCDFYNPKTGGANIFTDVGGLQIEHCRFFGTDGVTCIRLDGGTNEVKDCRFFATVGMSSGPMLIEPVGIDVIVNLVENQFLTVSNDSLINHSANNVIIKGRDNFFYEATPGLARGFAFPGNITTNISGNLQSGRGLGVYHRDGDNFQVNFNYDTYEINEGGTPTINTLDIYGAAFLTNTSIYAGVVKLKAIQPFYLGTAGNILGGLTLIQAGSVVTLQFINHTQLWNILDISVPAVGWGTYAYGAGVVTINRDGKSFAINEGGSPTVDTISDVSGTIVDGSIIRLLVKQAFSLSNAGNVVAAAGARSVNSVVDLIYRNADTKWYEIT